MKILYVTKEIPYGDSEAFILPEIFDHQAHGWSVLVSPLNGKVVIHEAGRMLLSQSLTGALLSWEIMTGAFGALWRSPRRALRTLGTIFQESRPSLLARNLVAWIKGLWLSSRAKKLGIEHIHVHWIATPATMGFVAAEVSRIPWSITAHRYDIAQENMIKAKLKSASFVRAIDERGAAEIKRAAGAPQHPIVLHMGVNLPKPGPGPARGSTIRAIVGARLVEKKGHKYLLEAMARCRRAGVDMQLDVYGGGPLESDLKRLARALKIDASVRWEGAVSHEHILSRLNSGEYRLAVLPSIVADDGDREGIPVFLMEAMAASLPVVCTANGGTAELVDNTCGVIVSERNAEELAHAIMSLSDHTNARELGQRGRLVIEARFSIASQMAQLRALIESDFRRAHA